MNKSEEVRTHMNKRIKQFLQLETLAAAALLTAAMLPAGAHHSFAAQYDSKKPIKLAGVVTRVEWTNPHVYIYVDVQDTKSKKVENWGFEMGPPHMLQKTGWKRNSLKNGEQVEVEGWMARDGSNHANARRVTRKSTGETLGAASSAGQTLTGGATPAGAGANTGNTGRPTSTIGGTADAPAGTRAPAGTTR